MRYLIPVILLLLAMSAQADKIYKWVDDKGQVHYGDAPRGAQTGVKAESATATDTNTTIVNDTQQDQRKLSRSLEDERHAREEEKAKKQQQAADRQQRCHRARDLMKRYESSSHLYDLDAGGNRQVLSDEQRKGAEDKLRKDIEKNCE
jgi:hypothetical protein